MAKETKAEETNEETEEVSQTPEGTRTEGQPEESAPSDGTDEQSQTEQTTTEQETDATGEDEGGSGEVNPSNLSPEERAEYYKDKFSNSTRENQRILEELKSEKQKFTSKEDVPTDEELSEKYPDFVDWDEDRKDNVRRSIATDRKTNRLMSTFEEAQEQNARAKKASEQIAQDDRLKNKEDAFMEYAMKDENQNIPLQTLTNSFLYEQSQSDDSGSVKQKNPALNTGSSNPQKSRSGNKLSGEEAKEMRENDYDNYVRKLESGEIEIE